MRSSPSTRSPGAAPTKIVREGKSVGAEELKVGRSVVVDGYGDSEDDLLAIEIRIVPALPASR